MNEAIMKPRGPLEEFFAAIVNDAVATFTRLNSVAFQKNTPRFEITVRLGQQRPNSRHVDTAQGIIIHDTWDFALSVAIITRPSAAPAQNTLHPDLIGRITSVVLPAHRASWTNLELLPLHFIAEALRQTGQPSTLNPESGEEKTTITWNGIAGIRPSAWAT